MGDWPRPPLLSPHSTVIPLPLSHTARHDETCVGCRGSLLLPTWLSLDPALLSAAQQSSPHSLPLPSPPPPAAPSLTLALYSPTLTSCTPCGLRPPTSLPLSTSPQSAVASPLAVPLPPLPPSSTPRETARTAQWSLEARKEETEGGACVRVVRGRAAKQGEGR